MRHERLAVILLLAVVLSTAPVLMPPRAPGFGATVATAAQDPSAVEAALGLDSHALRGHNQEAQAASPLGQGGRRLQERQRPTVPEALRR